MKIAPNSPRRSGKAWAVVDANARRPISSVDLSPTRATAERWQRIRSSVTRPLYPNAKWRVIRVEIKEVK